MTKSVMSDELLNRLMHLINTSNVITPKESNTIIFVIGAGLGVLGK